MLPEYDTKKVIRYAIFIVCGLLLLIGVIWFFSRSWLQVTAPSNNSDISIMRNGVEVLHAKGSSFFTSIDPGMYSVSVREGNKMSVRYINAPGGQFHTYAYTLQDTQTSRSIVSLHSTSLSGSDEGLSFINTDPEAKGYIRINTSSVSRLVDTLQFSQIAWNDIGQGFGLSQTLGTEETSFGITSISQGTSKNYSLPDGMQDGNQSVAISPNGTGWFAGKKSLYRQTISSLEKVVSVDNQLVVLAATDTTVLAAESIKSDGDTITMQLVSIQLNGSMKRGPSFSFHADPTLGMSASYSPDGSHIILTSTGTGIVYTSDLVEVDQLPLQTSVASATWKDDTTILYSSENRVLAYSLTSRIADVVGVSESGSTITEITYAPKIKTAYIATSGTTSNDTIQRIVLGTYPEGLETPAIQALSTYLPQEYTMLSCRAGYSTFAQPTVIIEQRVSTSNEQNAKDCIDATKELFSKYKIDPEQFTYQRFMP